MEKKTRKKSILVPILTILLVIGILTLILITIFVSDKLEEKREEQIEKNLQNAINDFDTPVKSIPADNNTDTTTNTSTLNKNTTFCFARQCSVLLILCGNIHFCMFISYVYYIQFTKKVKNILKQICSKSLKLTFFFVKIFSNIKTSIYLFFFVKQIILLVFMFFQSFTGFFLFNFAT